MNFTNKFNFDWGSNDGTEPSSQLKQSGFTVGYKPPAGVFNWFWRKTIKCTTELQEAVTTVEESIPTKTSDITNDSGFITSAAVPQVVDNLTSSLTAASLSANQGKVLNTALAGKSDTSHSHSAATTSAAGFISATDKAKLDGIATGANKTTVDSALSSSSTNPVQNKVVNTALTGKANSSHTHSMSNIAELSTALAGKSDTTHSHSAATTSAAGFMSAADKTKLNGIATGATAVGKANSDAGEIFNKYAGSGLNVATGVASHAEGYNTQAIGQCAHSEGGDTIASESYAHAEGYKTQAGLCAHSEGYETEASGSYAHAEGMGTIASGSYAHAEGYLTEASGDYSSAHGYATKANAIQFVCGKYNSEQTGALVGSQTATEYLFVVGSGTANTSKGTAFRINSAGSGNVRSAITTNNTMDFAEYFEWVDENPQNDDRRGKFVTLDGEKIRFANSNDDYILGVVTGTGAFIGNSASIDWQNKYLKDIFGTEIIQDVEIPETTDEITGEVTPAYTATQLVLNPDYDPEQEYVSREFRKEWSPVGMLGQVVVVDDGTCTVGGYCSPSTNGIGTSSDSGYKVMKRIDSTHIKVLVK